MPVHELTPAQARRVAVRAQWQGADRPPDRRAHARRPTLLQLDPTSAIAPSADLVLWSRLGSRYRHADLEEAVARRDLIELDAMLRPAEEIGRASRREREQSSVVRDAAYC